MSDLAPLKGADNNKKILNKTKVPNIGTTVIKRKPNPKKWTIIISSGEIKYTTNNNIEYMQNPTK